MHTGCPTHIITRIPHQRKLAEGVGRLSAEARQRLRIIDWHRLESGKFSADGKPNASLTCRHFGIHRSYFSRWLARYRKGGVRALESKSRSPKRKRQPKYSMGLVSKIREIRKDNPSWSAKKIRVILTWEMAEEEVPSAATIGRIIKKYNMFYRADIKTRRKRRKKSAKVAERLRKPYNLRATKPNEIIEFDMKHINLPGKKLYALCGIDQCTRRPVVYVSTSCSSRSGKVALQKIRERFGNAIIIINDNGSENKGEAEQWLASDGVKITQYWCRPHRPKDKPFIERFIGTLQTECLDYHYEPMGAREMQEIIDEWIFKYENQRPHEGLGFLTPRQFESRFYSSKHSFMS